VPDHRMMISGRLAGIDLFFGEENLLDRFHGVVVEQFSVIGQSEDAASFINETEAEGVLDGIELLTDSRGRKPEFLGRVIYVMLCCDSQECDCPTSLLDGACEPPDCASAAIIQG
jgi:hypothetical protein